MDTAPFASLMSEPKTIAEICLGIEASVSTSFVQDATTPSGLIKTSGHITQAEMKRRTRMCVEIFRVLRGDMKWSWQRAIDHLPVYLRKQLDGENWEPEARRSTWVPSQLTGR